MRSAQSHGLAAAVLSAALVAACASDPAKPDAGKAAVEPVTASAPQAPTSRPAAPVADAGDDDADDPVHEEVLIFSCKPPPGAPHEMINVFALDPEHEDDAGASVLIEVNQVDDGLSGSCQRTSYENTEQQRYACLSGDESLRMYWPDDKSGTQPAADAVVEVNERWLFWTKRYKATCTRHS